MKFYLPPAVLLNALNFSSVLKKADRYWTEIPNRKCPSNLACIKHGLLVFLRDASLYMTADGLGIDFI